HFRDVCRLVYLTAMVKAGSNAGFFTVAHVFLSSGTVIQILHTGLTAGSCKWHIFSKIAKVTFPRHVWHKLSPGKKRKAHEKHQNSHRTPYPQRTNAARSSS
ncbi:TPA: hypothetical protein ACWB8I_004427, partial [Escherichia coli]